MKANGCIDHNPNLLKEHGVSQTDSTEPETFKFKNYGTCKATIQSLLE